VQLVGVPRAPVLGGVLQLGLHLREGLGVDQLAQLRRAEQLAQELPVDGERLRPPFGEGRVLLVHVRHDVGEDERPRERGGVTGLDLPHAHAAGADLGQQLLQRGEVEDVAQRLPVGLEHDGEGGIPADRGEELLRLQPLHPERVPLRGPPPRQEQGAHRVLPEEPREERGLGELLGHQLLDLFRFRQERLERRQLLGVGEAQDDPLLGVHDLRLEPRLVREPPLDGGGPRRVHARAEGREEADAPVPELVAETLNHDRPVGRHHPRRLELIVHVGREVLRREVVERRARADPAGGLLARNGGELAQERADRAADLDRPPRPLPLPEGEPSGLPRRGGDDHAVAQDLLDPPGRGPEGDAVAEARLEDHLLVQLADARPAFAEVDGVVAAVGDRPRVHAHGHGGAAADLQDVAGAVPGEQRAQVGHIRGGIAPAQHVEDRLERAVRQVAVGVRAADDPLDLLDRAFAVGAESDDLLGEDVEDVARHHRRLDVPREHARADDGRLEEIATVLREDPPDARLPDPVPGAADALQAARDGTGGLHEEHPVDGPHVDPQLEGTRRDDAAERAGLQALLHLAALLVADAAVMGADQLFPREIVEPAGESLADAAAVDEDDGGAVGEDLREDLGVDRRPDAPLLDRGVDGAVVELVQDRAAEVRGLFGGRRPVSAGGGARAPLRPGAIPLPGAGRRVRSDAREGPLRLGGIDVRHVGDRDGDQQVEVRPRRGVDDLDRAVSPQKARNLLQRADRGGESDALRFPVGQLAEPLQRQGQVRAALRRGHRVHLVHDDGLDRAQRGPRARAEDQEEGLGGCDQDLGGPAGETLALPLRRVPRAHRDLDVGEGEPEPLRGAPDPGQRRAEVPLDVVDERLEGGHVEESRPRRLARRVPARQIVDPGQKRGQRLAGPRRRDQERVAAGVDCAPAAALDLGRARERVVEPGLGDGAEHGMSVMQPGSAPLRPRARGTGGVRSDRGGTFGSGGYVRGGRRDRCRATPAGPAQPRTVSATACASSTLIRASIRSPSSSAASSRSSAVFSAAPRTARCPSRTRSSAAAIFWASAGGSLPRSSATFSRKPRRSASSPSRTASAWAAFFLASASARSRPRISTRRSRSFCSTSCAFFSCSCAAFSSWFFSLSAWSMRALIVSISFFLMSTSPRSCSSAPRACAASRSAAAWAWRTRFRSSSTTSRSRGGTRS